MAVVMSMHWPEATLESYEQARAEVGWEKTFPKGGVFHMAYQAADGFHAVDIWESPEDFQHFNDERLAPAVQKIGIPGQPNVTFAPLHATFNPGVPQTGVRAARPAARKAPARKARKAGPARKAKKAARRAKGRRAKR